MRYRNLPPYLRIGGLYLVAGMMWILVSDRLLSDTQTLKGLGFVVVSGLLIAFLIRRAWLAHSRSEQRFRAVVEHAADIITIVGSDGSRKYHSPAFERVLGYNFDQVIGSGILDFVHPDDHRRAREFFVDTLKRPEGSDRIELRVYDADGDVRHLRVVATNLLDEPAVEGIVLNTRDITDRKRADLRIRRQLDRLAALHAIDLAILENHELDGSLAVVLEQATAQLGVDAAAVLLLDALRQRLTFAAGLGFRHGAIQSTDIEIGEGSSGRALLDRSPRVISRLDDCGGLFTRGELIAEEAFASYAAFPLLVGDEPKGVIEVYSRAPLAIDDEWLSCARALAAQAAVAVDNADLYSDLARANADLELAYDRTLEGWAKALELRDDETEGHSWRVVDLTLRLAAELGVDERARVHIRRGALLHDIGKVGIPDSVLLKPGPLDESEWEVMRRHPSYAYNLLKPIPFLHPAVDIPYCHHERWDGSGYPRGLRGEETPYAARMFAVVDVYDALTSDRPYRSAWSGEAAARYIREQAGALFDPEICSAFLRVIERPAAVPLTPPIHPPSSRASA